MEPVAVGREVEEDPLETGVDPLDGASHLDVAIRLVRVLHRHRHLGSAATCRHRGGDMASTALSTGPATTAVGYPPIL